MILWTFVHKGKDSWWLYAMSKNLCRKIIMMKKKETKCAKNARRKAKGADDSKVDASFLGWLNLDLDKQAELRACVRACFEKFVRETCSFVRIDTRSRRYVAGRGFFLESQMAADARAVPWQIRYQRHTHRKKKKNSRLFPAAAPWPPRRFVR